MTTNWYKLQRKFVQEGITGVGVTMDWRKILILSLALIAISTFVSANPLLGTTASGVDVNITTIKDLNADKGGNYIGSGNAYADINFAIKYADFNAVMDINFTVYLSQNRGDKNFTIASDLNADRYCGLLGAAYDTNYTAAGGVNCGYRWTTLSSYRDLNWFIDLNVEVWQAGLVSPNDVNSTDANSHLASFFLDRTTVTPTIVAPANNTQANGTDVNFTFTANDVNSGVRKYWVFLDGVVYVDNGRDGDYTFDSAVLSAAYHTLSVLYNDYADNNSAQATAIGINFSQSGGGSYCGNSVCESGESAANCAEDCSQVCGDGSCTGTESKLTCPSDCGPKVACGDGTCGTGETSGNCAADCGPTQGQEVREAVRSKTSSGKPTSEDIAAILTAAGASQNAIDKASEAVGKTNVERTLLVEKVTPDGGKASYESKLTVKVTNNSGKKLVNVKVVENVPKSVAKKAAEISSTYQFAVLKDDPILEFNVGEIQPNETKTVDYTVKSNVSETAFNSYAQPIVSDAIEVQETADACAGVNCDDGNSCTSDSCSSGTCSNVPVADGTACGLGQICQAGSCVAEQAGQPTAPTPQQGIDATTIGIIVVVVIVIGAGYYYFKGK